jgi:hypothetical protein
MRAAEIKKAALVAMVALSIAASPTADADPGTTITLNGQDIASNGPNRCDPGSGVVQVGQGIGSAFVQTGLRKVLITDTNDVWHEYSPLEGLDRGDMQVTNSGKTYTVTGHIPPTYDVRAHQNFQNGPLVPFEIGAACSLASSPH